MVPGLVRASVNKESKKSPSYTLTTRSTRAHTHTNIYRSSCMACWELAVHGLHVVIGVTSMWWNFMKEVVRVVCKPCVRGHSCFSCCRVSCAIESSSRAHTFPIGLYIVNIIRGVNVDIGPGNGCTFQDFLIIPNPRRSSCYVAWWVHPDLQGPPWWPDQQPSIPIELETVHSSRTIHAYEQALLSDTVKPNGYKSSYLDLRKADISMVQDLLVFGRRFVNKQTLHRKCADSDIHATVHRGVPGASMTLHIHLRPPGLCARLDQIRWWLGTSLHVQDVLDTLVN